MREDVLHALTNLRLLRRLAWHGYRHKAVAPGLKQSASSYVAGKASEGPLRAINACDKLRGAIRCHVPEEQPAVEAQRDDAVLGGPGDADLHVLQGPRPHQAFEHLSARLAVPDPDPLVTTGCYNSCAVRRPRSGPQTSSYPIRLGKLLLELAILALIQDDLRIGTCRDHPIAIRRVSDAIHKVRVHRVRFGILERRALVESDQHVLSAGGDAERSLRSK
mmetsp:Transcript_16885/g.42946  ORF Transcript_16885/g.42946 Transcript_16885/m.42946 type:complete len:220 (-) Transcript_16885:585-1244(-)